MNRWQAWKMLRAPLVALALLRRPPGEVLPWARRLRRAVEARDQPAAREALLHLVELAHLPDPDDRPVPYRVTNRAAAALDRR